MFWFIYSYGHTTQRKWNFSSIPMHVKKNRFWTDQLKGSSQLRVVDITFVSLYNNLVSIYPIIYLLEDHYFQSRDFLYHFQSNYFYFYLRGVFCFNYGLQLKLSYIFLCCCFVLHHRNRIDSLPLYGHTQGQMVVIFWPVSFCIHTHTRMTYQVGIDGRFPFSVLCLCTIIIQ